MMKKFVVSIFVLAALFVVAGCCCKADKKCARPAGCTAPCAKVQGKCPILGTWEFFIVSGDKMNALPVSPQPVMELCKGGVLKFRYAKDNKPVVVEGRWKVADGKLVISSKDGKQTMIYTITGDGTAETVIGKNDRLPENTKVVICRK